MSQNYINDLEKPAIRKIAKKRVFIPNKNKADTNTGAGDTSIAGMFAKDSSVNVKHKKTEAQGRTVAYRCETIRGQSIAEQVLDAENKVSLSFEDIEVPGKETNRSGFSNLVNELKPCDLAKVQSLTYLAMNIQELNARIKMILSTGASLYFVKEKLYFVSLEDMFTKQWFALTEAIENFSAETRSLQQIKGIVKSRLNGGRSGRKKSLAGSRLEEFRKDVLILSRVELMDKYDLSSQSVWRYKNMPEDVAKKLIQKGKEEEAENLSSQIA